MCLQAATTLNSYINPALGSCLFAHTLMGVYLCSFDTKIFGKYAAFSLRYTQLLLLIVVLYNVRFLFVSQFQSQAVTNIFGSALILLAGIVTLCGATILSERGLQKNPGQPFILLTFVWATIYMVNTQNLLTMFICFEIMFFPSAYYVYKLGYSKPSSKSLGYLAVWTYVGSFICLTVFSYLFIKSGSLDIVNLKVTNWTSNETFYLGFLLFLGFGVKIPIWPFYYWLIKVHVDSPTGFSIFLSGFLVKTALYCYLHVFILFPHKGLFLVIVSILLFGFIDSSLRMWETVDIKKLIALATVQEMNALLLLGVVFKNVATPTITCFIILHGLLSTLLFLLVDYTVKVLGTRQATAASGLFDLSPKTGTTIWLALLAFRGLPLLAKFFIEAELIANLIDTITLFAAVSFLIATFVAIISFFRLWFSVLYGVPKTKKGNIIYVTNTNLVIYVFILLVGCIFLLCLMCLFFFILRTLKTVESYAVTTRILSVKVFYFFLSVLFYCIINGESSNYT